MTIDDLIALLPRDDLNQIILEQFPDGGRITVDPNAMRLLFAGLAASITYDGLSALTAAKQGGWQKYFDRWRDQNYIT